jgi:hypothetical protein
MKKIEFLLTTFSNAQNLWSEESGIGWRIGPGMIQNSNLVWTWLARVPWERPTALKQNYPTFLKDFFYLIFIKFRTNQN